MALALALGSPALRDTDAIEGLLHRLGVDLPVVQAGMGGGLAGHQLAAATSSAGGLGTIGFVPPDRLRGEIEAARRLTDRPLAANLLLPFARRAHFEAASEADVVVTFWGRPKRRTDKLWMHQAGSVEEAMAAHEAGADAVIAQGVEAGGHVRGTLPASQLLTMTRAALPDAFPVLSAGGVADEADARARLDAGADAVVSGTLFLLTEESGAHPLYKARLLEARETILTELFGAGWPAPHRVVANDATDRWLKEGPEGPRWLRSLNALTAPVVSRLPVRAQARMSAIQRATQPLLGPTPPNVDGPPGLVEAGPLYAGECIDRIDVIRPAEEIVRELSRS